MPDALFPLPSQVIGEILAMAVTAETAPPDINKPWLMFRHGANNSRPAPSVFHWDLDSGVWISDPIEILQAGNGAAVANGGAVGQTFRGPILDWNYSFFAEPNVQMQFLLSAAFHGTSTGNGFVKLVYASAPANGGISAFTAGANLGPVGNVATQVQTAPWETIPPAVTQDDFALVSVCCSTNDGSSPFIDRVTVFWRVVITPV